MSVITLSIAIQSWVTFWSVYWLIGGLLTWKAHVSEVRKVVMFKEVLSVLVINMFWTFVGVIILSLIPLRVQGEFHIAFKLFFSYLITDIWFYHLHCFAHLPQIYKRIHKLHHWRLREPYALTAMYCTGYEAVIINCFSVGIGPIIFQLPPPFLHIWFALVAANSVITHSGYSFPLLVDKSHDLHHLEFSYNYGTSPYLDMLYGTYKDPSYLEKKNIMEEEKSSEKENILDE